MRRADRAAIRAGVPSSRLMENAALALVNEASTAFPDWKSVVAVCGPGNNGGDGLAAARLLSGRGVRVAVFTLRDPDAYRGDAASNAERARAAGLELSSLAAARGPARLRQALRDADGVLDALFGTGLARPLQGLAARTVAAINQAGRPVASADVPSGLSSDQAELIGPSVRAWLTIAFAAPKRCHAFYPARERCGSIVVADIGIARRHLPAASKLQLFTAEDVRRLLPARKADSHKGDFGRVAIVAGSRGKSGAAILAARGALRAGAGLVTVFCPESVERWVVSALPEAMTQGLPEDGGAIGKEAAALLDRLDDFDAVAAGPGLTTSPSTAGFLRELARTPLPLVCDADFLNAFSARSRVFAGRVLTPHPGEAGRLLGVSTRQVQQDRLSSARELARRSRAVVLLKGAASLVATADGAVRVNPTGTPLLATAGSGDVLAGAIAALLARGLGPADAASAAAFLHGAAAEALSARLGDAGLLASELADALPAARKAMGMARAGAP
jgi:ADP-dependent NAD(P)H-hydrate dehydratase / NAD(P)H-hydrate epimerase